MAVAEPPICRGQVYLVRLDPTLGSEIKKTRPASSFPRMTERASADRHRRADDDRQARYPWRPRCRFQGRAGFVALDQLRTVDVERLAKLLGQLETGTLTRCWNGFRTCSPGSAGYEQLRGEVVFSQSEFANGQQRGAVPFESHAPRV